jgi:hypothetical protein
MTTRRRPPGGGRDRLLTPRRQQILDYIRESMERRGFPLACVRPLMRLA